MIKICFVVIFLATGALSFHVNRFPTYVERQKGSSDFNFFAKSTNQVDESENFLIVGKNQNQREFTGERSALPECCGHIPSL
jgi:hypothetical protein